MLDDLNFSGAVPLARPKQAGIDLDRLADEEGVPRELVRGLKGAEGSSSATSGAGAQGALQVIPATGLRYVTQQEWSTPEGKARAGVRYIRDLTDKFGIDNADQIAAAYHAGEGAVTSAMKRGKRLPHTEDKVVSAARGRPFYTDTDYVPRFTKAFQSPDVKHLNFSTEAGQQQPKVETAQPQGLNFSGRVDVADDAQATSQPQPAGSWAADLYNRKPKAKPTRLHPSPQISMGQGAQVAAESQPSAGDTIRAAGRVALNATDLGRVLPSAAQDTISEQAAKGAAGLLRTASGVLKALPRSAQLGTRAPEPIERMSQAARAPLNDLAGNLERGSAEMAQSANRNMVNQTAQDVGGGAVASSPAMVLQLLGVPAPVAFGIDGYLKSTGRDADWKDVLKETGLEAASGALFEIPAPIKSRLAGQIIQKLAIVGIPTTAMELAAGKPLGQAITAGAVQGGFAAAGARRSTPEVREPIQTVPDALQAKLRGREIDDTLAAREAAVSPSTILAMPPSIAIEDQPRAASLNTRAKPTPSSRTIAATPTEDISAQPGVGIQPDTGNIMYANSQIEAIQRRIRETEQVKNPTHRTAALRRSLDQQLAEAVGARNRILDPKVQAQLEGKPLADVLAERKASAVEVKDSGTISPRPQGEVNEPQTPPQPNITAQPESTQPADVVAKAGIPRAIGGTTQTDMRNALPESATRVSESVSERDVSGSEPPREQNRRQRNVATGKKGQFAKGFKEPAQVNPVEASTPSEGGVSVPQPEAMRQAYQDTLGESVKLIRTRDGDNGTAYLFQSESGALIERSVEKDGRIHLVRSEVPTANREQGVRSKIAEADAKLFEKRNVYMDATHPATERIAQKYGLSKRQDVPYRYEGKLRTPAAPQEAPKTTETKVEPKVDKTAQPLNPPASPPAATGIAQRVEQARRVALSQPLVESGRGVSAEDSVARGRDLLSSGRSPEQSVAEFKRSGSISADAMALVRAKHEELARTANQAFDEHGIDSPQFKTAEQARSDFWQHSVKPMQTEWAKTGMAQQGETAIDTRTFYGIYRTFKDIHGKEMSPKQQETAKRLVQQVARTDARVESSTRNLFNELDKAASIRDLDPATQKAIKRFVDEATKESRAQKRQVTRKSLDDEAATIKSNIAAEFARLKSQQGRTLSQGGLGSLDPDGVITKQVVKLAQNRVKAGVMDIAQLVDDVHSVVRDFADVSRREIAEAIAGVSAREKREPTDWAKVRDALRKGLKADDAAKSLAELSDRLNRGKLQPDDGSAVWQQMRTYIDQGKDFREARNLVADDLAAKPEAITRAIAQKASTRKPTDDLYRQMSVRRAARVEAEAWVRNTDRPLVLKTLSGLRNAMFNIKTGLGLHATVGPITHAGRNLFIPERWGDYFRNVGRTWKAAYSESAHERMMQDLQDGPNYIVAKRAGLANDPHRFYDDYQNIQLQKVFGRLGRAGNRGFDVLKIMRQDFFDSQWNKLAESQKTPEMAQAIADISNHATGAIKTKLPAGANTLMFAPQLEGSRWAALLADNARAVNTLTRWEKATPSEKYFAKTITKQNAQFIGTYAAALALNQGILIATGSKDRVNLIEPTKGDFLRFKIAGRAVDPTGGIIGAVDFMAKLAAASFGKRDPRETRLSKIGGTVWDYGTGKLSPIAGTGLQLATREDYRGRPLPFSWDKGTFKKPKYDWLEYVLTQQSPIPVAQASRDVYHSLEKEGMGANRSKALLKGLAVGVVGGGTGIHVGEDYRRTPLTDQQIQERLQTITPRR